MEKLEVISRVLGLVSTNAYIVYNKETKKAIMIDPAASPTELIGELEENGLTLEAIFLTHGHFDHIMALDAIRNKYNVKAYIYDIEEKLIESPYLNGSELFIGRGFSTHADILINEETTLDFLGFNWKVIHTPGHTRGSCCYYIEEEKLLLAGDTLSFRTYGRTDLPTGSEEEMCDSIINKLFLLPDDVVALPGHERSTNIGYEKTRNEVLVLKKKLGL